MRKVLPIALVVTIVAACESDTDKLEQLRSDEATAEAMLATANQEADSILNAARLSVDSMAVYGQPENYSDSLATVMTPAYQRIAEREAQLEIVRRDIDRLMQ